jgi:hypothetical protein
MVNGSGPYEFVVDTGSQLGTVEPSLAAELNLKASASVGVTDVSGVAQASVVRLDSIEANHHKAINPLIVIQEVGQLQTLNSHVRGILGLSFLAHFDVLIDYGQRIICLDDKGGMRQSINGEHIPVVASGNREADLPFTQPLLISVHLSGNESREMLLDLDSGASLPFLFAGRSEAPAWLADQHRVPGSSWSGTRQSFSVMAPQDIRVGKRSVSHVTFVTPAVSANAGLERYVDGLLPTTLFKRVFISYEDHFVVFDPR